jgi:hypothetical protein
MTPFTWPWGDFLDLGRVFLTLMDFLVLDGFFLELINSFSDFPSHGLRCQLVFDSFPSILISLTPDIFLLVRPVIYLKSFFFMGSVSIQGLFDADFSFCNLTILK